MKLGINQMRKTRKMKQWLVFVGMQSSSSSSSPPPTPLPPPPTQARVCLNSGRPKQQRRTEQAWGLVSLQNVTCFGPPAPYSVSQPVDLSGVGVDGRPELKLSPRTRLQWANASDLS
ncbi:hypothetical protein J1614_007844 [Plenodomus biglobosus]|nr:hypothetical protein J1614_007844 [Plenodomus biglobosus]